MRNPMLPFDGSPGPRLADGALPADAPDLARDRAARERAVDPRHNVVLEASAGTGKTRVLVDRYVNLLRAGVNPSNILAITFTRKAAAEMRERIVATLRTAAERGEIAPSRWHDLRERIGDIAIGTIDAFCLGLLREFPLEADVDPGFAMADDTDVPLLVGEALDRTLRICRSAAGNDEHVALVFAQLGDRRVRTGLAALLNRRLVAPAALARYLDGTPRDLTVAAAARGGAAALVGVFASMPGGLDRFLETGPPDPAFLVMGRTVRQLAAAVLTEEGPPPALVQAAVARVREYFLTQDARPRARPVPAKAAFASPADWQVHKDRVARFAPAVADAQARYRRDLNVLVARGVWRMFRIAESEYRRTLDAHAVLDFSDVLARTLDLLRHMEEFAQSRYRLESRYHHVLVDEFQDTSRAQWELISLLVQSWGDGSGLAHTGPLQPSIFIVGDRKQSIYRFRDADVAVLQEARLSLETLRPDRDVRRSISRSFRSTPVLLAFVNDVCQEMDTASAASGTSGDGGAARTARRDAFQYTDDDRFPVEPGAGPADAVALGLIAADTVDACAATVAHEIGRLIGGGTTVRDRVTGVPRAVRPGDVGVLFRSRESHRAFEDALERLGIPAYVYKGLGFFDADEVRDVLALVGYLADPASDLRAAAWMRSRFVRLSDEGLRVLAPRLAEALLAPGVPAAAARLEAADARVLATARLAAERWRTLVDRVPPAELIDTILTDAAYLIELRGPRAPQARENLKKLRALVRRMQNRGYMTLSRLAARLDRLAVGEEANALIDAADAVNLMTIHAAKGLEFPVVFVVNLARGTGGMRDAIRVVTGGSDTDVTVSIGDADGEADEDVAAAEREETKRLLYVALTRARDRLYLGAVRREGRLQPARGSLAEVVPPGLLDLFGESAPVVNAAVSWRAASGATHTFRVCAPGDESPLPGSGGAAEASSALPADFGPTPDAARLRRPVGAVVSGTAGHSRDGQGRPSDRLLGTLVHRLIRAAGVAGELSDAALRLRLPAWVQSEDVVDLDARSALFDAAVAVYRTLVRRADVQALYTSGDVLHEVPFAMLDEGAVLRGTIDCLIRSASRVIVLEFKTGQPRPEHQAQADLYGRAARLLFPGAEVEARLVYADRDAV